jgi:hypothetical protein
MTRVIARIAFLALLLLPVAGFANGVTILNVFPGDVGPGPKDAPDNTGAVGPKHVVDFTDAHVVIHDKRTGAVVQQWTQTEFWKAVKPGFDFPKWNDPRLLYDPLSGRWFGVIAEATGYLAVSDSADPTQGWHGVKLPMQPCDVGMKLGVDRNGLYITYAILTGDTHTMHGCYAIPKADAIAAGGPSLAHLQTFTNLELDSFPATDLDPHKRADAPEIVLNREFGNSFSKLYLYRITWAGMTASISKAQTIPLSQTYVTPNAASLHNQGIQPAPGGKLRYDEARRTTCVYAYHGSVFTCNGAKRAADSRPGIFWCEVRARDGALLQEGFVDSPDCDYLIPSLAVDAHGNIGLGCTRTSEKEFASVVVMMHAAGDPKSSMRPPVLAAKGTAVHASTRGGRFGIGWGNYNATCVDPTEPTTIWTSQEYATSDVPDRYTTCWVAFTRANSSAHGMTLLPPALCPGKPSASRPEPGHAVLR